MGRREHQKVTVIGAYPSLSAVMLGGSYAMPIGAGQDFTTNIVAPEGHIGRIKGLSVGFPSVAGATSGSIGISLLAGNDYAIGLGYGEKNEPHQAGAHLNGDLIYKHGMWFNADNQVYPVSQDVQHSLWHDYPIDDQYGVRVVFRNFTNVLSPGTASKYIWVWVELEKVVS
jgi:hypothetical protein